MIFENMKKKMKNEKIEKCKKIRVGYLSKVNILRP